MALLSKAGTNLPGPSAYQLPAFVIQMVMSLCLRRYWALNI